jgi:isopenicillin-N epimerase
MATLPATWRIMMDVRAAKGSEVSIGGPASTIQGVEVSWDRVADLFPLDPDIAYLNHGAYGVVPIPVQRAQVRLRDEMEANPTAFFTRGLHERLAHTRQHVATFLGADPAGCALVPNVSAATQIVFGTLGLAPGDEVLLTTHGYGAVRLAAGRLGLRVVEAHFPAGAVDDEVVAAVVGAAVPGRTRLAIVDHVTSPTAMVLPVARIAAALRELGVPVMVDGAHAPGMLPVDVSAVEADFWVGNVHKWAFAPRPTALLVVAAQHRPTVYPLVVSWRQPAGFPEAVEHGGTLDYTAWLATPTGLHLLRTLGAERVRQHNADLAAYGQRVVGEALGTVPVPGPWSPYVSMRLVRLPLTGGEGVAEQLRREIASELRCELPVVAWDGELFLRLGAQVYNRPGHYDRLAEGLPRLMLRRRAA